MDAAPPTTPPMGRLDAFDVGPKKLTVQTEFFPRPQWRIETKIYLGGELKKTYREDMTGVDEGVLQKSVDDYHNARIKELMDGLRKVKS